MDPFSSASELARCIRAREVGSEELLDVYLERVSVAVSLIPTHDALAADSVLGPLYGVPLTIKESFNLAGTPTTFGLPPFRNNIAQDDALAVSRLKAAGAIVFGKTNVPQTLRALTKSTAVPTIPGIWSGHREDLPADQLPRLRPA